ncbi:hypothetical protein HK101_008038 [Irineochytrium annulatum]|nr:hypothetical protein HK101_008038 [Irineochytrium annulatum]
MLRSWSRHAPSVVPARKARSRPFPVLNNDVVLTLLEFVETPTLAVLLIVNTNMFQLAVPVLWARAEVGMIKLDKELLTTTDPNSDLVPRSPAWRWRCYLNSIHIVKLAYFIPPPPVAQILPWLGRLEAVCFMQRDDKAVPQHIQDWINVIMDLMRAGQGPKGILIMGNLREADIAEMLTFRTVKALHLNFAGDHKLRGFLQHGVPQIRAGLHFLSEYLPRHGDSVRRLTVDYRAGVELSAPVHKLTHPSTWRLTNLTNLMVDLEAVRDGITPLLTASTLKIRTLKIFSHKVTSALTDKDISSILALRNLSCLEMYSLPPSSASLAPLAAMPLLESLKVVIRWRSQAEPAPMGLIESSLQTLLDGAHPYLKDLELSNFQMRSVRLRVRKLSTLTLTAMADVGVEDWGEVARRGWPRLEKMVLFNARLVAERSGGLAPLVVVQSDEFIRGVVEVNVPKPRVWVDSIRLDQPEKMNAGLPNWANWG